MAGFCHPEPPRQTWLGGRRKERAPLDDLDHNKVTCTLLGGPLSHVRVSHGRRWGGGCILGGSYMGFTSCTGATGTRHCPWAPPGPPWGLTWSPVTTGVTLPGVQGARSPQLWTSSEDISVLRNSRVTSNEKRSWNYCSWQMAKLHTTGTYEGFQVPLLKLSKGRGVLLEAGNISSLLLCMSWKTNKYLGHLWPESWALWNFDFGLFEKRTCKTLASNLIWGACFLDKEDTLCIFNLQGIETV